MKKLFILAALLGSFTAQAGPLSLAPGAFTSPPSKCITGPWVSRDKALHFAGTAALVFGTDFAIKQVAPDFFAKWHDIGLAPGIAAGAIREIYKATTPGYSCEYASMAYDIAGLVAGYYATNHWLVIPQKNGVSVAYSKQF